MEATGNCHWLVDLLAEIGHELWVGGRTHLDAVERGTRPAATAAASLQAGDHSGAGEERTATPLPGMAYATENRDVGVAPERRLTFRLAQPLPLEF
jgi:hypothetical protein